jgi:hypothetical protein
LQWRDAIKGFRFIPDKNDEVYLGFEAYWQHNGWLWRPRQSHGNAIGPFLTSTAAYQNAKAA